jgi:hypothetical protein
MNTCVFGQHDPGKTPMGKTSKRDRYIMEISKQMLQQRNETKQPDTILSSHIHPTLSSEQ